MKNTWLYLVINLGCIGVPFLCSFHPRWNFFKNWHALWPALFLTAVLFLFWDAAFTLWGVWGFNPLYVSGWFIGPLPIEEILFFFCIPYACLFTYFACRTFLFKKSPAPKTTVPSIIIIVMLLFLATLAWGKLYTVTTFVLTALVLSVQLVQKKTYLPYFYVTYGVILPPFLISNGILTGSGIPQEVVWYNDAENLGVRLGTIPVEDAIYAFLLLLVNVNWYEYFLKRSENA